jgi:hypothetical protein
MIEIEMILEISTVCRASKNLNILYYPFIRDSRISISEGGEK